MDSRGITKTTIGLAIMMTAIILTSICVPSANAAHLYKENFYQDQWCRQHYGQTEVQLPDRTRADCVNDQNVIEFDFGPKWYEAIGQSLYYSLQTGKRAGVVLIIETLDDRKYWIRMNSTIEHFKLPIDTWIIE